MSRTALALFSIVGLVLAVPLIGAASTRPYGPPWIAVELPANPLDPATRDAALVIRTYRHDRPESFRLTGTAEGIIRNERRSIPLEFEATGRPGVFRVDQTWPTEGNWLVAVSAGDDATMVIELGGNDGGVNRTSYYGQRATELSVRSIRTMNRKPSKRQITQNLKAIASAVE